MLVVEQLKGNLEVVPKRLFFKRGQEFEGGILISSELLFDELTHPQVIKERPYIVVNPQSSHGALIILSGGI